MHIAYCGPIGLKNLSNLFVGDIDFPYCAPYPFGATLVKGYLAAGHRVTVVTCARVVNVEKYVDREGRLLIYCVPQRSTLRKMMDLWHKEVLGMRNVLTLAEPDVIHAQWTYEYAYAALTCGCKKVLVTIRDAPWKVVYYTRSIYFFLRLERTLMAQFLIIKKIRYASAISPYMADNIRKTCLFREKVHIIPNGVDSEVFSEKPKIAIENPLAPVIASVTEWGYLKNPKTLLKAFKIILTKQKDARLILWGNGFEPNGIAWKEARRLGIADSITFMGYRSRGEIQDVLWQNVNIYVNTTREESLGMTFLEAMAQGIPCVGGKKSGAVPWILDGGQAGILCDIESPTAVAESICKLIADPSLYRDIAGHGYKRCKEVFNVQRVVSEYCMLLQEVFAMKV